MFTRTSKIIASTVVPILVATGIAVAAQGKKSSTSSSTSNTPSYADRGGPHPGGPPPFLGGGPGAEAGDLTYSEAHIQRNGKAVVVRTDRGKIKSIASDSLTITENDGSDVQLSTDKNTKVFAGPQKGASATLSDLKAGQSVIVNRDQGQVADVVAVAPKGGFKGGPRGRMHRGGWDDDSSSSGQQGSTTTQQDSTSTQQ